MVAAFYECDAEALGCCDDSGGSVGDVFRFDARELFVLYAARCANKKWLGNLVLRLMESDSYGVRDLLIDCATEYLPEEVIREMVSRMLELADREAGEYQKRHWLHGVESLARQLKDAPLFERARLASWGTLSTAACVDIARVYLECGNELAALTWLEKIPEADTRSIRMYGSEMQAMPMAQYQNVPKKQRPTSRPATALVSRVTNMATATAGSFARFGCVSLNHCWASKYSIQKLTKFFCGIFYGSSVKAGC